LTLCQLKSARFEIFDGSSSFLIELICASSTFWSVSCLLRKVRRTNTIYVLEQLNSLNLLIVLVVLPSDTSIDPFIDLSSASASERTYSVSHPLAYTLDFESIFPTRNWPFGAPHNPRRFSLAYFSQVANDSPFWYPLT
jgi:hypothetical protein